MPSNASFYVDDVVVTDGDASQSTATVTDSTGRTDSVTPTLVRPASSAGSSFFVDDVTVTDGEAGSLTVVENTGGTDAGTRLARSGAKTDSTGTTDTVTGATSGGTGLSRALTDGAGRTDTGTITSRTGTTTDSTGKSDAVTFQKVSPGGALSQNDPTGTTDAPTWLSRAGTTTDPTGAVDAATGTLNAPAGNPQTRTISDATSSTDAGVGFARTGTRTDAAGTTDSVTRVLPLPVHVITDAAGVRDDGTAIGLGETLSDGAGPFDQLAVAGQPPVVSRTITDPTGARDALNVAAPGSGNTTDGSGTGDGVTPVMVRSRAITDTAAKTDSVSFTKTTGVIEYVPAGATDPPVTIVYWAQRGAAVYLKYYDQNRNPLGLLPEHVNLVPGVELNQPGSILFDYPLKGVNADFLSRPIGYISLIIDGEESPDWYVVEDDADDPSDEGGRARLMRVSGRGIMALLEQGRVYPATHDPGEDVDHRKMQHEFKSQTPGAILRTLITRAKARGCFPEIVMAFTSTHDSAGVPWPKQYDVTYTAGLDYLSVLTDMTDKGWLDARTSGFNLQVYAPSTEMGVNRPGVIMRRGKQVIDSPNSRRRSRRGLVTTVLGIGAENRAMEKTDASAEATYGRREGYVGDGRVTTTGTLNELTTQNLAENSRPTEAFQLQIALDEPEEDFWQIPGRDFFVGDYIRYDEKREDATTLEPLRVRSISWEWDGSQGMARTATIELADKLLERSIKQKRRVEGVLNGSSVDAPPPVVPGAANDVTVPSTVTGISIYSDTYLDPSGLWYASAYISWAAPTTNTDGSDYDDGSHFLVSRMIGTGWGQSQVVTDNQLTIDRLIPGSTLQVRIAAVDQSNHRSVFTTSSLVTLATDTVPPPAPAGVSLTSRLGQLTISWNGTFAGGQPQPPDFRLVEIHLSPTNGFTPSSATFIDTLSSAGLRVIPDLNYGTTYYVKIVAVDQNGNVSDPSDQVAGQVTPLVDTDFILLTINGANIQPGTINAADKLIANSITGAQVAALSIEAGNLAANSITADKITAGAITAEKLQLGTPIAQKSNVGPTNLIPDGGFEDPQWRTLRLASAGSAFSISADPGESFAMRINGATLPGTTRVMSLIPGGMPVVAGEKYWLKGYYRTTAGAALNGAITFGARFTSRTGAVTIASTAFGSYSPLNNGTWYAPESIITVPVDTVAMDVIVGINPGATTGSVMFDLFDLRPVLTSTGATGRFTEVSPQGVRAFGSSSMTGQRVELTGDGLNAYDAANSPTLQLAASTGNLTMRGQLVTAFAGRRIVINPSGADVPEIRFYGDSGTDFANIWSWAGDGVNPTIMMNSANNTAGNFTGIYLANDAMHLGYYNDSPWMRNEGGEIYMDASQAWIGAYDAGVGMAQILLQDNGAITTTGYITGPFSTLPRQALIAGNIQVNTEANAVAFSYGHTATSMRVPIVSIRDDPSVANTRGFVITANSTTGFTVQLSGLSNGAWAVYYLAARYSA